MKFYKIFTNVTSFVFGGLLNLFLTAVVLVLAYQIFIRAFQYGKAILTEETAPAVYKEVAINIPPDSDTLTIGEILENNGLIDNKYIFYLQTRLNGSYKYFKAGDFNLNTSMSQEDIMELLQTVQYVPQDDLKITIAEGFSVKQIGDLAESKGLFTAEEFLAACERDFDYFFLENINRPNRLEGYLFPDTYNLPPDPVPEDLIIRMLNRFEGVFAGDMQDRAEELGITLDDVVTMASVIEKEIKVPNERAKASAVIYNRLEQGMNLQMCSTILYALDKRKDRLLDADLEIKSPYNTYKNSGLPVGPICNPGLAAIEAALYPEDSDVLYFVVKDEETGEHVFTNSYDDFLQAKTLYNQKY